MTRPPKGRLLAIDHGERRIGLAVSDPLGMIASPAGFVERRAGIVMPDLHGIDLMPMRTVAAFEQIKDRR